jgi:hypothetical protein
MFIFVGECPSDTAKRKRWTWYDGRLAAKQLFDALVACGVKPHQQQFVNLFTGPACRVNRRVVSFIRIAKCPVVAMGGKVQRALADLGILFRAMVHPAARGRIRRKDRYTRHVRTVLEAQS